MGLLISTVTPRPPVLGSGSEGSEAGENGGQVIVGGGRLGLGERRSADPAQLSRLPNLWRDGVELARPRKHRSCTPWCTGVP